METKYIIVKTKAGKIKHLKSQWLHHFTLARENGFNSCNILEAGLFLDSQLYILECNNQKHLEKHHKQYIGNRLNFYHDLRLKSFLKGRELESQLYYSKKTIKQLPNGD